MQNCMWTFASGTTISTTICAGVSLHKLYTPLSGGFVEIVVKISQILSTLGPILQISLHFVQKFSTLGSLRLIFARFCKFILERVLEYKVLLLIFRVPCFALPQPLVFPTLGEVNPLSGGDSSPASHCLEKGIKRVIPVHHQTGERKWAHFGYPRKKLAPLVWGTSKGVEWD